MTKSWEERFRTDLATAKAKMDGIFTDLKSDLQQTGEQTQAALAEVRAELVKQHDKRMAGINAVGEAGKTLEVMSGADPSNTYEQIGRSIAGQRLGVDPKGMGPYTRALRAESRASDIAAVQGMVDGSGKPPTGRSR